MRALYSAATGMSAQQTRLDTIANNIANVGTTGFKKSRDAFQDLFYQQLAGGAGEGEQFSPSMELGGGVRLAAIQRDESQGALASTGNPLNVAIQGDAYFVVETENGEPLYTRDGSFTKDPDGYLVTASGMRVGGDVQIPEGADQVTIDYDGTVHGTVGSTGQDLVLGKIELARFVNPSALAGKGGNLFVPTLSSGEAIEVDADTSVQLLQGYLEGSNVDVASELIDMIQAQRIYELNSKVVQAADETLQTTANLPALTVEATALEQSLVALVTDRCAAVRVEVRWLGIDPARLAVGGTASWDGDPCRPHPELSLWWTAGADTDRFSIHPELVVWVKGKVAGAPAAAGQPVTAIDGEVRLDALIGGAWSGAAPIAIRSLKAGDPLCAASVRSKADAASGSAVILRVRSGALEIRTEGRLLEDGWVGKPVRAYVDATQRVVTGRLSEQGTVDL